MLTEYVRELADQTQIIKDAAAERGGQVRVRFQPQVLQGGQYRVWRDVRWTMTCESAPEAFALRDALKAFFKALTVAGPARVAQALVALTAKDTPAAGEPEPKPTAGKAGAV